MMLAEIKNRGKGRDFSRAFRSDAFHYSSRERCMLRLSIQDLTSSCSDTEMQYNTFFEHESKMKKQSKGIK